MKYCVIGPAYPLRGGIAHHTTLLCKHLAERHDVEAVTFKRLYPGILFPGKSQTDPSKEAISVRCAPMIDSMNPLTWKATGDYVRSLSPDWVLIQWWHPFFGHCLSSIASRVGTEAKVGFICHNVLPHEGMPLAKGLSRRALGQGDGFIVHSSRDREDLERLLPHLQPGAIHRTVHPEYELFPITGISKSNARKLLGVDGRVILFFGLVRKYKGLMDLINAMPHIKEDDITCLVVGEFYDKPAQYVERIHELALGKRIQLVNRYIPNEEVEPYFAAADLVVLPYRTATQSGIAQIAYRFERPVVATSVGGLPESIDDGRTGLLVPPRDPVSLAGAIDRYFDEAMEERLLEGIRQDRHRFSWDRVIETIEELSGTQ